ncbi:MAG: HD domain-containing protein [Sedimentisphaerales bacterium]|nr:HD domain-containing protein [Sedimentisphaerales bacterium]
MGHKFINEIAPGETINDVYMIREPILRSTTRGDLYMAMYICDRSGQLNGRMWQATEAVYNSLPKPGFVHINGRSEVYQSNLQIVVNNISVVDSSEVEIEDFLARTAKDVGKMFGEVKKIVGGIKHKQLKALMDEFLADEELMGKFCEAPAAMKLHHNYLGGLLEHTHNMLGVAEAVFGFYPEVNRDLVLAGIFIHDMGKTDELCYDMAFSYTDSGQLIGHISKGFVMLGEKAESLKSKGVEIDEVILDSLGHIIVSHHGQYEFGSPKLPATPEAFMVNYIDDLDAKIRQVTGVIENEPGDSDWTGWQNSLGTRLYKKRIE